METISTGETSPQAGRMSWLRRPRYLLLVFAAVMLAVYFFGVRPHLMPTTTVTVELAALGVLILALSITLLVFLGTLLITLIVGVWTRTWARVTPWLLRLKEEMIVVMRLILVLTAIIMASQWLAHTPPILGTDGTPLPGSIASLEKVKLGGVDQWLVIRGNSVDKPVLLFLSGGPGGSELGRVLHFNQPLEERFVVVVWEQRGCGKPYPAINPKSALAVEQYTSDIIELSEMLRDRFNEDKIYLMGHSWGTIIGVRAVQERPDLFYAYIGTGQMVSVRETDQTVYRMVLEHAHKTGDAELVGKLKAQGEPPYYGDNPVFMYMNLFGREYSTFEQPYIKSEKYKQEGTGIVGMAFIPEYGWLDRVGYLLGGMNTFNVVYPQLQDFDFRKDALEFEVPVYFILGRHDVNTTYWIAEEHFNKLQAPHKRLYIFEDSGHGMIWQETDEFHDVMFNVVLPETYHR